MLACEADDPGSIPGGSTKIMIIKINNIILNGIHGWTKKEESIAQRFRVDVEVNVPDKLERGDDLGNTIDYRKIKNIIHDVIQGKPCRLIETLGEKIADQIIENKNIISVDVSVAKIDIWDNGFPSVTISRFNSTS